MLPKFDRHQPTGEPTRNDFVQHQQAVGRVLDEVSRREQLSGEVLKDSNGAYVEVALTTGVENLVEHTLGKAVRGWRLVDVQGSATVWRVASPTTTGYDAARHLVLSCSANVTVKLEVWP